MFRDRYEAGEMLAKALEKYKNKKDVIVLAIPRGALQIGEVLHKELNLPLDIIITKKIPHPLSEELAIGAVGPGGEYFIDKRTAVGVIPEYIDAQKKRLDAVVMEGYRFYRGNAPLPELGGKTVIIVDDGIATGSTMIAAIHVIRKQGPAKIVVAVPLAATDALRMIERETDEVVCLDVPELFFAIGQFYESFPQVENEEAIGILKRCRKIG